MNIKGKLLVSLSVRDLEMGQSGWVAPSTFLYLLKKDGKYLLYCNLEASYLPEKESDYIFKVTKTGVGIEDFEFDFSELPLSLSSAIKEPTNLAPYVGPYDISDHFEIYSLIASYKRLPVNMLNVHLQEAQFSVEDSDGDYTPEELDAILEAISCQVQEEWKTKNPVELAEQFIMLRAVILGTDENGFILENQIKTEVKISAWPHMKKSLKKRTKALKNTIKEKLVKSDPALKAEYSFKFEDDGDLIELLA